MTIPNTTYRVLVEKLGAQDASQFVGNEGEVFYDPNNPLLKLSDGSTVGGLSVGQTGDLIINDISGSTAEYQLQLSDTGKAILFSNSEISIPSNSQVDFPIGSIVTLIVSTQLAYVFSAPVNEGEERATIILAGTGGQTSIYWSIPAYNIATLFKIGANTWILSGPGITES